MTKQYFQKTIIFLVIATMAACAGMPSGKKKNTTPLAERVNQFMQAMVDENWEVAYIHFDSAFRNSISEEIFKLYPRKMKLKSYAVDEINIFEDGRQAEVILSETLTVPQGFTFKDVKKKQTWLIEDGQWVLLEPPTTNPMQK